jgi:hypothetical protein
LRDNDRVAMSILAVSLVPGVLSQFLPSVVEMDEIGRDPVKRRLVRRQYVIAGVPALVMSAAASWIARSVIPFAGALAMLTVSVYEYERAMRPTAEPPRSQAVPSAAPAPARSSGRGQRAGRVQFPVPA